MTWFDRLFGGHKKSTRSQPILAVSRSREGAVIGVAAPALAFDEDNRSVRVFVSSTFLDMQTERDNLVTKTFPALRAKYRARGVEVFEVDLRWGITRETQERGDTLPTLLAEIDRCRPYFIGLLGDRYGSIPPQEALTDKLRGDYPSIANARGMSVTAMEIMHGVLANPDTAARAVFFERDSGWDWVATLSAADRAEAKGENEDARTKLGELKALIRRKARVVPYSSPEDIQRKAFAALDALLEAQFPQHEGPDAFVQTQRLHGAYARERRRLHIGAESYLRDLNRWMETTDAAPKLVTGTSGSGKSTLIANWLHGWRNAHPDDLVFEHYLGADADSADPMLLMRRLWQHLNLATGDTVALPGGDINLVDVSTGLAQRIAQALITLGRGRRGLLIALDGLDKLSSEQNLRWLPLIPGVHLLASSLDGEAKTAARKRGFAPLEVRPLNEKERQDFIQGTLERWQHSLEPRYIERILRPETAELAGSPLCLKTVLDELRVSADHVSLARRLEVYRVATDMPDLFDRVLSRLEDDCDPGLVARTLPLVWASRAGLEETEIIAISGASRFAWAALRNGLDDALRDQAGRMVFGHDYLRRAVEARYLKMDERKRAAHAAIAAHFEHQDASSRKFEEWPWQVLRTGDLRSFSEIVTDIDNVAAMLACAPYYSCRADSADGT